MKFFSSIITLAALLSTPSPVCGVVTHQQQEDSGVESPHTPRTLLLESLLTDYIEGKDARIGVAVITDEGDTVSVNGGRDFPMMSVFKFPLAMAVAEYVDRHSLNFNESVAISVDDLKENTWSPMLRKYGRKPIELPIRELLEWSLRQSDNNAADILLKFIGGIEGINAIMRDLEMPSQISVGATEDDMHSNPYLSYLNLSTPEAMAKLFDRFNRTDRNRSDSYREIAQMLETCRTGTDRLAAPLADTGATIGHKTGTGDVLSPGRISAINDCGYVRLPDGRSYAIAVFVADSAYDPTATAAIIADLSTLVYNSMTTPNL